VTKPADYSRYKSTSIHRTCGHVQGELNTSLKELKADTSCILHPAVVLDLYCTCGGYLDPIKVVLGPYTPGTFMSRKGAQDLASQLMQSANLAIIENPDEFSPAEVEKEQVR
jgi:hypothetical protein